MRSKPSTPTLPLLISLPIKAGFPNPAEDATGTPLDLNQLVIHHPVATFYLRVDGDSMSGIGLKTGDIVVVDKSLEPRNGDIVVAAVDGEFTLKRLRKDNGKAYLVAENPDFSPIDLSEVGESEIWGVVTHAIQQYR
ncbi:MAG TPA: translesion error-prone DNA polymerase V autoproteolytic subunit [Candidatus Saccharimonadales bacterium]|nr:translesion error-prone DNA polymerase V autoproteolytic subunit [Candidatus Saccharimonadales bacterium]